VLSIIQGSIKNYHGKSQKRKMAGTPCKMRRYMPLQDTTLYKARRYNEDRKTFNNL